MIRLRQRHWTLAFSLALATHLAAYLYTTSLPGSASVYRGGGTFDQVGRRTPSTAGIFVQLGNSENDSKEKAGKPVPEKTVSTPAKDVDLAPVKIKQAKKPGTPETPATLIAALPVPKQKPKLPNLWPEMETLGRRLSVQGPAETAPPAVPNNPPGAGEPEGDEKAARRLSFSNQGGRTGTASGNRTGEVRELNYEDQVLLWLKRHGAYPYEAAMYRLEDTVTLKFAINRQGDILYYELIKKSKYHLLNKAIQRMMDRSSPVPPIPPEVTRKEMTFTIPVHFDPHLRP